MRLKFIRMPVLAATVLCGAMVSGCKQAEAMPAVVRHTPPPERRSDRRPVAYHRNGVPQRQPQQRQQQGPMRVYVVSGDLAQYEPLPEPVPLHALTVHK